MNQRKILIIAASLRIGGAEKVARDIALYDELRQFEYHYVVFSDRVGAYEAELTALGCRIFHLDPPGRSYRAYWKSLIHLMREHRYHAVHAHNMFNCGISLLAARLCGVPIRIAHAHSTLNESGGPAVRLYERLMRLLILSCATDLVGCGVRAGIRLFGERSFRHRGELILNGIDTASYRFDPDARASLRRELGVENVFLIGHTGHLMTVKNQRFLIEAMAPILRLRPDAKLLLLGDGPDRPMLESLIRDLALQERVLMPGNVTDIPRWLSAMDVFAFPSLYEGMPLSLIEAQANGLPCIISDGVPSDVHLTPLIRVLALDDSTDNWAEAICSAARSGGDEPDAPLAADFDVHSATEHIRRIYRRGI